MWQARSFKKRLRKEGWQAAAFAISRGAKCSAGKYQGGGEAMKVFRNIVLFVICTGFGLLVGNVFRRTKQPPQNHFAIVETAQSRLEKPVTAETVELSLIAQLERDLANSSGVTRLALLGSSD